MLLLMDSDHDPSTGWYGYDYLVNREVRDERTSTLMAYESDAKGGRWGLRTTVPFRVEGARLELAVPRAGLGLADDGFVLDFHWCDNPADLDTPVSLCVKGDSAPNRRFNYRCVWSSGTGD
jgi:hypothetical protein